MKLPTFSTKKELFAFLVKNKDTLIAQKKMGIKYSDAVQVSYQLYDVKDHAFKDLTVKANEPVADLTALDSLKVKVVINTTNLMDSHEDVHLPGLWNKSLSENKSLMHLQEHAMEFAKIIADANDLKAYVKRMSWLELGFPYAGYSEALIFESVVKKARNPFMFDQYGKGYVRNHSVGMQYVQLVMAINDPDWGAEYEAWEKYFPEIANQDMALEVGYFWAVKEAKVREGSAVPIGSNWVTPTLENNMKSGPVDDHLDEEEPPAGTPKIDYAELAKHLNFK